MSYTLLSPPPFSQRRQNFSATIPERGGAGRTPRDASGRPRGGHTGRGTPEPSAPTEPKMSVPRQNARSNTALSWAMSCIVTCAVPSMRGGEAGAILIILPTNPGERGHSSTFKKESVPLETRQPRGGAVVPATQANVAQKNQPATHGGRSPSAYSSERDWGHTFSAVMSQMEQVVSTQDVAAGRKGEPITELAFGPSWLPPRLLLHKPQAGGGVHHGGWGACP